jgi:hexokinase
LFSLCCASPLHVCSYCTLDIISVDIVKGRIKKQDPKEFYIDKDTKNSSSYENLLNFIVNCIAWFIKDRNIWKTLPIAFIFPFPVKQESLTCGKLIRWTKEFKATGAKGEDVVQLLKNAASKRKEVSIQ